MPKLKLNDLLIENVNTWGNVEYNIPMRSSYFETRTSSNVGHRHIPPVYTGISTLDKPLPTRVSGRDRTVLMEGYKTTSSDYCVKASYNKANERSDKGINCRNVIYMTGVEKKLMGVNIQQPSPTSEFRDTYRGVMKPDTETPVRAPDPQYIFDIVASGRNEAPVIPESATRGYRRHLDPYYTTYRYYYKPFTTDEQYGIGAKDHITYYSESPCTHKVRGFGPKYKEIWMPIMSTRHRPVYDPLQFKLEYKGVAKRNTVNWIKGVFKSETKSKYTLPYASSPLVTSSPDETFDLAPFQPNPYQTNAAPYMWCSEYCHISQGTPVNTVIDQISKKRIQEPCLDRFIVSNKC